MTMWALISVPVAITLAYVPHGIKLHVLRRHKAYDSALPRADAKVGKPEVDALVQRCTGAHYNQLETVGPYTAAIAACLAVGVPSASLSRIATGYIGSRVAFNVAYISPQCLGGAPRSLAWFGAMASIVWAWVAVILKNRENESSNDDDS